MPAHELILESGPPGAAWLLAWDETTFTPTDPDGHPALEAAVAQAHRLIDLYDLDIKGKSCVATPAGPLTFRRHRAAARDLRAQVEAGLRADPEYRRLLAEDARQRVPHGLALFVGA